MVEEREGRDKENDGGRGCVVGDRAGWTPEKFVSWPEGN